MDALFEEERKARISGNLELLKETQHKIIAGCVSEDEIIQTLKILMNKRKQDHGCIKALIRTIMNERRPIDFYCKLLEEVLEGKIYLEEERLEVVLLLKVMAGSEVSKYYEMIKRVPAETFMTVSDRRRNMFIFEQLQLSLVLNKLHDAELISRKVIRRTLNNEELAVYLNYMVLLKVRQRAYLEASRVLMELQSVDQSKKNVILASFYCLLSSCLVEEKDVTADKREQLELLAKDKYNDPVVRSIVDRFRSDMLVDTSVSRVLLERVEGECRGNYVRVEKYEAEMKLSVTEHNFFVLQKFTSRIHLGYLPEVLGISEEEAVEFISEMVNEGYSSVRINQRDRIVNFGKKEWSQGVDRLLDKIVEVNVLIHENKIMENK